jgi:hypothetical protein
MLMQITDHLYAMRPMNEPATAAWGLRISDTDAEKLKAGLEPQDMDDKWHIYVSTTEPATSVPHCSNRFGRGDLRSSHCGEDRRRRQQCGDRIHHLGGAQEWNPQVGGDGQEGGRVRDEKRSGVRV